MLFAVPLGPQRWGFGRTISRTEVEFYEVEATDPEAAGSLVDDETPVAFTIGVMHSAFKEWTRVDGRPPRPGSIGAQHYFFKQDPITRQLSIYWIDVTTGEERERPASLEEVSGLERAAAWSANHVEDRLRDQLDGRSNVWVESLRPRV